MKACAHGILTKGERHAYARPRSVASEICQLDLEGKSMNDLFGDFTRTMAGDVSRRNFPGGAIGLIAAVATGLLPEATGAAGCGPRHVLRSSPTIGGATWAI